MHDNIGSGKYLDLTNNDLSMNKINKATGYKEALEHMSMFDKVLSEGEMIEVLKDEE